MIINAIIVVILNIAAAIFNFALWYTSGDSLNLFCFVVSSIISVVLAFVVWRFFSEQ